MHKKSTVLTRALLLCFIFFCFFPAISALPKEKETLTISTYYPSPYGVYKSIRLFPIKEPSGTGIAYGAMYFNETNHCVYVFTSRGWETASACEDKGSEEPEVALTKKCVIPKTQTPFSLVSPQPLFEPKMDTRMPSLHHQCAEYCKAKGYAKSNLSCPDARYFTGQAEAWYIAPLSFLDCEIKTVNYKGTEDGLYCPRGGTAICSCNE